MMKTMLGNAKTKAELDDGDEVAERSGILFVLGPLTIAAEKAAF